ncbi:MAG: hypothetical protein PVH07_04820 [Chloroflexota bacterium]
MARARAGPTPRTPGSRLGARDYVLAFPRALFWPAVLVYKLLKSLDT